MTVQENLQVALPAEVFAEGRRPAEATARCSTASACRSTSRDRVEDADASRSGTCWRSPRRSPSRPKLLILDEPTAPLGGDAVELLFRLVREQVAAGTSVVYITHRMAEVRELADRVTVLRDGRLRGTVAGQRRSPTTSCCALILGRQLDSTFPPKHAATDATTRQPAARRTCAGPGFTGVSPPPSAGEIVGLAGVVGNGQSELLRALAGLSRSPAPSTSAGRALSSQRPAAPGGVHAGGPARRGPDDEPVRAGERRGLARCSRSPAARCVSRAARARPSARSLGSLVGPGALDARRPSPRSPAATSRRSSSPGRCSPSRSCCSPTSRPRAWTSGPGPRSTGSCARPRPAASRWSSPPPTPRSSRASATEVLVMSRGHVVATLRGDEITEERHRRAAVQLPDRSDRERARSSPGDASAGGAASSSGDYAPVGSGRR